VKWAVESSVPFVTKSGGHSEWSTIDQSGIIIDLSKYASITVDKDNLRATLRGSILSKQVAVALAEKGLFTALGNGNPVGAIPYFLNGGASIVTSCVGYGSDQILSARLIDAQGNAVEVSEETKPDLLWALRGAGQFFGLVTELVVRAHPFSRLGNDKGVLWAGAFVFPLARAGDVAGVMEKVVNDESQATAGLVMVTAPPPARQPALVVAARYTGDPEDAQQAFQALYALQPLVATGAPVPIQNASDGREAFNAKGDFKRFATVGLRRFDPAAFLDVVSLWEAMVRACPDALSTSFNFQWDARPAPTPAFDSANSLHDVRLWQNNFIWHTDAANRQKVDDFSARAIATMRGPNRTEYIDFQNATRTGPLSLRFRDPGKLAKLKALKLAWDPHGVFTTQLLSD
jgi:FAD/FMN-containing dehydrogenase